MEEIKYIIEWLVFLMPTPVLKFLKGCTGDFSTIVVFFFPPIGRGCANKLLSYLLVWHLSSIFEMMAV